MGDISVKKVADVTLAKALEFGTTYFDSDYDPLSKSFYAVPKYLFTAPLFVGMSLEAKFLYGCILNRAGLSVDNQWYNKDGHIYVYFTRSEICALLGCTEKTATKVVDELADHKLIEREYGGRGHPCRLVVRVPFDR
jgi:hypothetical protein